MILLYCDFKFKKMDLQKLFTITETSVSFEEFKNTIDYSDKLFLLYTPFDCPNGVYDEDDCYYFKLYDRIETMKELDDSFDSDALFVSDISKYEEFSEELNNFEEDFAERVGKEISWVKSKIWLYSGIPLFIESNYEAYDENWNTEKLTKNFIVSANFKDDIV